MLAELFLGFVALMAAFVSVLCVRYMNRRSALFAASGLLIWLFYVGFVSFSGILRNQNARPPGMVFLFVPVILLLAFLILKAPAAVAVPLWILLAAQTFRVIVELFIHGLWTHGLVPKMLTFEGANVDIYIGASAPFIAWFAIRGQAGRRIALAWNVLGLIVLANVVFRAVLTTPGPLNLIHAEVPDQMIGTFPYTFIPGFFVPLAVVLHALALRTTGRSLSS